MVNIPNPGDGGRGGEKSSAIHTCGKGRPFSPAGQQCFGQGLLVLADATSEPQIGTDLLSRGVDLGSIKEINSTFVGDCHEPLSNLQRRRRSVRKAKCFPNMGSDFESSSGL